MLCHMSAKVMIFGKRSYATHFIVNSSTFQGVVHWSCMGRFIMPKNYKTRKSISNSFYENIESSWENYNVIYFIYCSANSEPSVFTYHKKNLQQECKKKNIKDSYFYINISRPENYSVDLEDNRPNIYLNSDKRAVVIKRVSVDKTNLMIKIPTVTNHTGECACGFYVINMAVLVTNKTYSEFFNYPTEFIKEKELLKLSLSYMTLLEWQMIMHFR